MFQNPLACSVLGPIAVPAGNVQLCLSWCRFSGLLDDSWSLSSVMLCAQTHCMRLASMNSFRKQSFTLFSFRRSAPVPGRSLPFPHTCEATVGIKSSHSVLEKLYYTTFCSSTTCWKFSAIVWRKQVYTVKIEKQLFHYVLKLHGNLPIKSVSVANMHSWPSIAYHKQTNSIAVFIANIPSLQTLVAVAATVAAGCNILSQWQYP